MKLIINLESHASRALALVYQLPTDILFLERPSGLICLYQKENLREYVQILTQLQMSTKHLAVRMGIVLAVQLFMACAIQTQKNCAQRKITPSGPYFHQRKATTVNAFQQKIFYGM